MQPNASAEPEWRDADGRNAAAERALADDRNLENRPAEAGATESAGHIGPGEPLPGQAAPGIAPLTHVEGAPENAGPARFFNRELSWIAFNERVFAEAQNPSRPLLERVKFLAIYSSNLDEFMMVRLPGLRSKVRAGVSEPGPDGLPPQRVLAELRAAVTGCLASAARLLRDELVPALAEQGIFLQRYASLADSQKRALQSVFERDVFPVCTPLGFDPAHPFPFISNQSTNLAVVIEDP